jgi:lipoprotein
MKKILAIFCLAACFLSLCACGNNQESEIPEGMIKAGGDANDFYFYYDDTWTLQTASAGTDSAEIMIKPAADRTGISPNASLSVVAFSLSSEKKDYAVNDQWKEYKEELQNAFPSFEYDETKDEALKLDNVPAGKKRYNITIGENTYTFVQILCIRYANVYQITFTCLANEYEARNQIIDTVVNNFHFN